jgi:hypothetical protein
MRSQILHVLSAPSTESLKRLARNANDLLVDIASMTFVFEAGASSARSRRARIVKKRQVLWAVVENSSPAPFTRTLTVRFHFVLAA